MSHPSRTARVAVTMCVFLLAAAVGCDRGAHQAADTTNSADGVVAGPGSATIPPPPAPASAASAMTDTVPLESLVMWDAGGAQAALLSDGLPPRVIRSDLSQAGLPNGIALGVGPVELHFYFFGDIAAADAAYRSLDVRDVRPVEPARGEPVAMINNNMLVIFFGGDAALRRQIGQALRPGADNFVGAQVEP